MPDTSARSGAELWPFRLHLRKKTNYDIVNIGHTRYMKKEWTSGYTGTNLEKHCHKITETKLTIPRKSPTHHLNCRSMW